MPLACTYEGIPRGTSVSDVVKEGAFRLRRGPRCCTRGSIVLTNRQVRLECSGPTSWSYVLNLTDVTSIEVAKTVLRINKLSLILEDIGEWVTTLKTVLAANGQRVHPTRYQVTPTEAPYPCQ